ncbi:MAG: hypothetical protein NUV64_00360 [Parcubacteria group bacterium]|nr:hypothetical protein [Parcubacteria group bacterium]MCR4342498.1 hypothetical protein [Patescibacteria group bacterium]
MENQTLFKKILKIIIIVAILLATAVVGYLAGGIVKYGLDIRKADKITENFQNALEQPYKDDIYGGKTPEETWAMYMGALKEGDIELASRYHRVGDQEKERQFLQEAKKDDTLKVYLGELSAPLQKDTSLPDFILADKTRAHYFYMVKEPGTDDMIKNRIEFYLNPYTKIWKIINL